MGKKRLTKGVIIEDKDKKVAEVLLDLDRNASDDEFILGFKKKFPQDWQRVEARYAEYESLVKKRNIPPMARPFQYVLNAARIIRSRYQHGEDLQEILKKLNAPKPAFIEAEPADQEALFKKLNDVHSYEKRIDAIKKLGKYKCLAVEAAFLEIMKTDPVNDVREAAHARLKIFGYDISSPRKAPAYVDKDLHEKLLEVANSLHEDFSYERFESKFRTIFPLEFDMHKYQKKGEFKNWLTVQIRQLPRHHEYE